jgi:hypothetical protein
MSLGRFKTGILQFAHFSLIGAVNAVLDLTVLNVGICGGRLEQLHMEHKADFPEGIGVQYEGENALRRPGSRELVHQQRCLRAVHLLARILFLPPLACS